MWSVTQPQVRRLVPGSKLLQDFQLQMQYNNADRLFICHSLLQDSQSLALAQWQKSSSFGGAVSPNTALDNQENHYSFFFPPWFCHISHSALIQTATFSESLPALKCGLHFVQYNLNFISQCPLLIKLYFWIIWKMNMGTVNKIITNHDYNNALNTRHEYVNLRSKAMSSQKWSRLKIEQVILVQNSSKDGEKNEIKTKQTIIEFISNGNIQHDITYSDDWDSQVHRLSVMY